MIATGYIAEVPGKVGVGTPALRFDYEPITEAESKAIRAGWRKLDDPTQVNEAVSFLLHHVSSCQESGFDKGGNPTWRDVDVNEHNLRTALPKGHFARMLWIVMGVHESDPVPGEDAVPSVPSWAASKAAAPVEAEEPADPAAPPAKAPEPAAVDRQSKDPAATPIAPAAPEKPATVDAGTSTPDQAAKDSATTNQTK